MKYLDNSKIKVWVYLAQNPDLHSFWKFMGPFENKKHETEILI